MSPHAWILSSLTKIVSSISLTEYWKSALLITCVGYPFLCNALVTSGMFLFCFLLLAFQKHGRNADCHVWADVSLRSTFKPAFYGGSKISSSFCPLWMEIVHLEQVFAPLRIYFLCVCVRYYSSSKNFYFRQITGVKTNSILEITKLRHCIGFCFYYFLGLD